MPCWTGTYKCRFAVEAGTGCVQMPWLPLVEEQLRGAAVAVPIGPREGPRVVAVGTGAVVKTSRQPRLDLRRCVAIRPCL